MTWPRLPALACLALLFCLAADLAVAGQKQELPTLLAELRRESTARADFTEQRYLAYLTEPVTIEGQLTYRPDGLLERVTTRPKREKMVIDERLLTIEKNAKDPPIRVLLADHPPLKAFVSALRALLAGDLEALETAFEATLQGSGDTWRLRLDPKDAAVSDAVDEIQVEGRGDQIESVEIQETNGNRTLVALRHAS